LNLENLTQFVNPMDDENKKADVIASERELFANSLEEAKIHQEVIINVCEMEEISPEMKVEIMLQSIKDLAVVFHNIKYCNSKKLISDKEYMNILEIIISKFHQSGSDVDFDPRRYSNYEYV
jgi:hypothetical protein